MKQFITKQVHGDSWPLQRNLVQLLLMRSDRGPNTDNEKVDATNGVNVFAFIFNLSANLAGKHGLFHKSHEQQEQYHPHWQFDKTTTLTIYSRLNQGLSGHVGAIFAATVQAAEEKLQNIHPNQTPSYCSWSKWPKSDAIALFLMETAFNQRSSVIFDGHWLKSDAIALFFLEIALKWTPSVIFNGNWLKSSAVDRFEQKTWKTIFFWSKQWLILTRETVRVKFFLNLTFSG